MGFHVSVAQLDRASPSEGEGLGFESQRAQIFEPASKVSKASGCDTACGAILFAILSIAITLHCVLNVGSVR